MSPDPGGFASRLEKICTDIVGPDAATVEPGFRPRLADPVRRRHDALRHTAGLNDEVFDALLLMPAGSWEHDALRQGRHCI
jgi:hypothetical protein